jgi:hypothetical protein
MRWTLAIAVVASLLGIALGVGLTWAELGPFAQTPAQLVAGAPSFANRPLPRAVVVGSDTHNFGHMELDTKGRHTFEIRNDGNADLTLAKGTTTCKCTLSNLDHDRLAPGKSAKVELEWTALPSGHFRHSATIRTNDPRRPNIELSVEGQVSHSFELRPYELVFTSPITVGEGARGSVNLLSFEKNKFEITSHQFAESATAEYFEVQVSEMPAAMLRGEEGAKSGKIITLVVKPGLPLGPIEQKIRLETTLPGEPAITIPIQGRVIGDITVVGPPRWVEEQSLLVLGSVKQGKGIKSSGMQLIVKGPKRDQLDLKVLSVTPDFLKIHFDKAEPIPGEEVVRVPFTVEVPPNAPIGEHNGRLGGPMAHIELNTGHPSTPKLNLYVSFAVEP